MHNLKLTFDRIKPIIKESIETEPEYGYCAAQNSHYFGYKFHGVCSLNGVITSFDLSKATYALQSEELSKTTGIVSKSS